ncbi:hypothetical protein B0A48_17015 [Cryoendolithus antarcticus]|uniref:Vacuolar protein sorting-associated protein 62 n=1 Tax=Cryoendolithus antarcticus TaxID=1507870 RepID=A0A1V8SBM5_9PEZI|nr:hypothetical protein B0A48_17015 [Cryoendolithus antarcticus]
MVFLSIAFTAAIAAATPFKRRAPSGVPSFVLDYAPVVYLFSGEQYKPADIGAQLANTQPEVNAAPIANAPNPLTLDNLNALNGLGGANVYLTSTSDVTTNPAWLKGVTPDASGKTGGANSSVIVVNDHGNGNVDAFYLYFYAFDFGGIYFGVNVGNHVGDWEHTMPVVYSANGTHANYAIQGTHDHTIPNVNLPFGPLEDHTDAGALWDPSLAAYYYSFDVGSQTFTPYDSTTPTNYLYFNGHWGDAQYPTNDKRQHCVLGISQLCKYTGGPTGPLDKQLNRTAVCPDNGNECIVRPILTPK